MLKFNAIVIGIGNAGISAVNKIAISDMPEIRTAVFCPDDVPAADADYIFKSKHDFTEHSGRFFTTADTAVFIVADCSDSFEISLACELAFITARMGGFSVALTTMPSPNSPSYSRACDALEEMHDCFDSVVRFNESYCDSFEDEATQFFKVLSRSMSTEAISGLRDFAQLKKILERPDDIYFAYVYSKESYDSHSYRAKCLEMKLCAQTYVDTANCLNFFYSCRLQANTRLIKLYSEPIEKINIAFMNTINTYISDNTPDLDEDEFVFAVICSK